MSAVAPLPSSSILVRMGQRYGVDPDKMLITLKSTCFKGEVSNEQMMALLVVADQYGLNPWTREIFAFPQGGAIVPVVGVDGWARIINSHPQYDGMDFKDGELNSQSIPAWIECTIHRKDRSHPITTREYFVEVVRDTGPWKSHPRRMLRHKATIQAARLAFGFAGIYDTDEGERIIEAEKLTTSPRGDTSKVDPAVRDKWVGRITDILAQDKDEFGIADDMREANDELMKLGELAITVFDQLAAKGIVTKANYRKWLDVKRPA